MNGPMEETKVTVNVHGFNKEKKKQNKGVVHTIQFTLNKCIELGQVWEVGKVAR